MKKACYSFAALVLACGVLLSSCMTTAGTTSGKLGSTNTTSASTSTTNSNVAAGAAIASALLSQSSNSTAAAAGSVLSAVNSGSLISAVVGLLTGGTASATSIIGTWTYQEPTVQFQSENLLAQAGGIYAAQTIVTKLTPYYEKFGFKSGALKVTFKNDNTCSIVYGTTTIPGTYTYNSSTNTLNIKGLNVINISAYVTLSYNQLALTFDSSKLLSLVSVLGGSNASAQTSAISQLANSYTGMKTGFLMVK